MNRNIFQRWSLKTRVTLGTLLIFVISIWVLAVYASRTLRDDMQSLLSEQQFSTASFLAKEVNEELRDRMAALESTAARISPATLGNTAALQAFLEQFPVVQTLFNAGIIVTRLDGVAIAEVPRSAGRIGVNYLERADVVAAVLRDGKATIGQPIIGKKLSTPIIAMVVPIRDSQGKLNGTLTGVTELGKPNFLDKITHSTYGRTGGYLVISPQNRRIVTATDKRRIMEVLPPRGVNPQLDRFMEGYEGSTVFVNTLGVEVLSSVKAIPAAGWYVVASLPAADAFAPIGALQRRILLATLLLTLLAGILTWWMLRRQLAPMLDTAKALAKLPASDQSPLPLPIARRDEVGDLIGGFNRLLENLAQRENALRESEERFRTLIEWSPEPHIVSSKGKIVYVNPAAVAMFGAGSAQDLTGTNIIDRVHPDSRELHRSRRKLVIELRKAAPLVELKYLRLDGSAVDVEVQTIAIVFNGAEAYHTVARDVTLRKQAEAMMHRSAQRLRMTLDHSWICVWESDLRSNEVWLSAAWASFLGNPPEDTHTDADKVLALVHPEDRTILAAKVIQALKGGSASCELRVRAVSGEWRWIQSHGRVIERDSDGRALYMSGTNIDITERKHAEQARARLAAIVENSNDAIFSRTLDGTILSWNAGAEKMLGFSAAEAIGQHITLTLPPEIQSRLPIFNEALLRGEVVSNESERITRDGRVIQVRSSLSPIKDAAGSIVGISIILQDIGERKRTEVARAELEAQLREAQKMEAIGTLAGGIAHDFNNIIATIMGNTELAHQDSRANPQALASLEEIQKAARRARDLVQQILSFSRRQPTERKPIALAPVVEESARLLRATLPARVALEVHCAADVPAVLADATQIEQALINVSTNAMQAMHGNPGRIVIHLDTLLLDEAFASAHPVLRAMYERQPGRTVRLEIKDDGPGMDAATLKRIFEPFFTTKPVDEGTGLGLSVVHGILQAHQGAIDAESEPGKGATFTFYLPASNAASNGSTIPAGLDSAVAPPAAHAAATGMAAGAAAPQRGRHILYLDDDEALVYLVERLLKRQGFRVSGYIEQHEALAALRAAPHLFDLVVSDYNMPGMSGLDLAREVRAIRADLPVAIASGFIDETLRAEAAGAGVCELIFKADSVEEFCAIVRRLAQGVGEKAKT